MIEVFLSLPSPTVVHLPPVEGQEKQLFLPKAISPNPDFVSLKDFSSLAALGRVVTQHSLVSPEKKTS